MDKDDMELLERLVDKYTLTEVISGLSYICGEKAEHIAVNWQDVGLAKVWMLYSERIDRFAATLTALKNKISV